MKRFQHSLTSAQFAGWAAFLAVEPDVGTRADGLAAALGTLIGRVEGTLGGRPPSIAGRLINWGGEA